MDIAVIRIDPADEDAIQQAYEIAVVTTAADLPDLPPPDRDYFFAQVRIPWPGSETDWLLARIDGEPAGYADVGFPMLDNTENVVFEPAVHPAHRRRGVGRALHAHVVRRARELGRKRIMSFSPKITPGEPSRHAAGTAFAESVGATSGLIDVRRRLDLAGVDDAVLDVMLAEAWTRADGYSLVRWIDATPEEYLDDVAYLDGRLVEDAPMGDLVWEPHKVDADRIRATDAALRQRGRRLYHTGIRHDASGRLVAWTALSFNPSPDWHAWQQITIVEPRHRGHRLGTIVKIENLRYAQSAQPGLRIIDTFNAAANDHMISINEAIGFRPVDAWHNWQQVL